MNPINITLIILSILTVISLGTFLYFYMNKTNKNSKNSKNISNRIKGMEVFHIYNNTHTYPMAKEKCKMYGGRLATESEVRRAYQDGANWCNYGWSADGQALFPTQEKTYNLLKKARNHSRD